MKKVFYTEMPNGLKIVVLPSENDSVTACLRGLAGSNYEQPDEIGCAHILEHIHTNHSSKYQNSNQFRKKILQLGGKITGTTSRDDVAFLVKVMKKDWRTALLFLYELFSFPDISEQSLKETTGVVEQEIKQNFDIPQKHIGRISYKILFPNSRFSSFNTGNEGQIRDIQTTLLKRFRKKFYIPNNFVLSVCGKIDPLSLVKEITSSFGKLAKKVPAPALIHHPNYSFGYQIETRPNLKQLHLNISYVGRNTSSQEKYALFFLGKVLANRLQSQAVKIPAYIVDAASFSSHSYGIFGVYSALSASNLPVFFDLYERITDDLGQNYLPDDEYQFIRNKIRAEFAYMFEKTSLRADYYSELLLYNQVHRDHKSELTSHINCTKKTILKGAVNLFAQPPKITIIADEGTSLLAIPSYPS